MAHPDIPQTGIGALADDLSKEVDALRENVAGRAAACSCARCTEAPEDPANDLAALVEIEESVRHLRLLLTQRHDTKGS